MKQEKIDEIMLKIDKKCKLPKYWDKFIKENSKRHHLIIKDKEKKKLYCSNCNRYFSDKTIKVRDYVECPHCHKMSCVYGMNYYQKSFEQSVVLVQRMDKQVVIRDSYLGEKEQHTSDHFINTHPETNWEVCIDHAVKLGLGNKEYKLIEI